MTLSYLCLKPLCVFRQLPDEKSKFPGLFQMLDHLIFSCPCLASHFTAQPCQPSFNFTNVKVLNAQLFGIMFCCVCVCVCVCNILLINIFLDDTFWSLHFLYWYNCYLLNGLVLFASTYTTCSPTISALHYARLTLLLDHQNFLSSASSCTHPMGDTHRSVSRSKKTSRQFSCLPLL